MIGITGLIGKVSDGVNALAKTVALVLTAVLISVISIGIIFRYLFNSPLSWEQEASTLLFIWVAFLGASIAFHMKAHVSITFLFDTFLK
jgi:TRAP-type C4-dicarboxylate transport system permease small subunit